MPDARTSGLETTVFAILDFVLGCGEQDVAVPFDGRMNLDMLFNAETGYRLGVEYDGAYWHRGRERSDDHKTRRLVDYGFVDDVMRIREEPLPLLGPLDLPVPRGTRGPEVALHVLLHLSHTRMDAFGRRAEERIHFSLERPARGLKLERILCDKCQNQAYRFAIGVRP